MHWQTCCFLVGWGMATLRAPQAWAQTASENAWLSEMDALDERLIGTQRALIEEGRRCRAGQDRLRDTQEKHNRLKKEVLGQRKTYGRRLLALVRLGPRPRWTFAQGGEGLSDALYLNHLMAHLARRDQRAHDVLVKSEKALEDAEALRKAEVQAQADGFAAQRRLRDQLAERRALKSELSEQVLRNGRIRTAWARENTRARAHLMALIASEQDPAPLTSDAFLPGLKAARGQLQWPAEGPVTLGFGQQQEAHFGTVVHHHGLDIAAPLGSPARAVAAGRVVYADWLRGYGQVVIVDHADGYHAVLAHLSEIGVKSGEWVLAGEKLGAVGETGSLRGPVLYLELRHHGAPIDPMLWLEHRT